VGTLVAVAVGVVVWGLTKLVVGVGACVAWGLTKLVSSSSSSGLEEKLDTDHYTPETILEANDRRLDRWRFPASGKLKMNTDGSVTDSRKAIGGPAGFGVVIRDESGSWIMGFYGRLKDCSSVEAELLAIHKGLQFIQACDFGKVFEIESDCEPAVNLIKGKTHTSRTKLPIEKIVEECKMMVLRMGCTVEHIGNKANKVADEMAQRGRVQKDGFVPIYSPPDQKIESWRFADVASARSEN